jgi:recombination protein RecR
MTTIDPLRNAISQLARLPGVGEKTATRLIYWLLKQDPQTSIEIGTALCALPIASNAVKHAVISVPPISVPCAPIPNETTASFVW